MPTVARLARHPVKGFSPEMLTSATLRAGEPFPGDRLYAVENGPSGFDPAMPEHLPKIKYLQLMRHAGLATLDTRYDDASSTFTISEGGKVQVSGTLSTAEGRRAIEAWLQESFASEARGTFRVLSAPGYRFMDSRKGFVSLIGRASLNAIAERAGQAIDARRFRANILVEGLPEWGEFDLVGRRVRVGGAVLRGLARIDRCAATDVDPVTATRNMGMVGLLERAFGHHDCGVYFAVESGGTVAIGDTISDLGPVPAVAPERNGLPF